MAEQATSYCVFCDVASPPYQYLLHESDNFRVVCDNHPLREGHLLVIPKVHLSCVGAYSQALLDEFVGVYDYFSKFILHEYGAVSTFEHGVFGQTVSHSHVQILPFTGVPQAVMPEGSQHFGKLGSFRELSRELREHAGYLFFSIGGEKWLVDTTLASPGFFRERFATAMEQPERADYKAAADKPELMQAFTREAQHLLDKWSDYYPL